MSKSSTTSLAPGQLLGYSLQVTECLRQLLLALPGTTISVEAFEDVGAENSSGSKIATQTKSSLTGNPVADRSVDFWKTFANWIDAASAGELLPSSTQFHLRVFGAAAGSLRGNGGDVRRNMRKLDLAGLGLTLSHSARVDSLDRIRPPFRLIVSRTYLRMHCRERKSFPPVVLSRY